MTARTFGRKRVEDENERLARRAAFLAAERAHADRSADTQVFPVPSEAAVRAVLNGEEVSAAAVAAAPVPTDRSLKAAYLIWFCTGLAGGHRFYLRRPFTGALQALLFFGCWGAALAEYYAAFLGLAFSCLWLVADGLLLVHLHRTSGRR
jgi:hypothetical protein